MPNKKITAMPSLAGNQVPTDLVTAVDLSAAPVNQNVKSTLNDLFAVITKNITDRAIRFQAPGSAPAVSSANQGALYHNGTAFVASSNGGAYEQLYTLSAQSAALVFAGPTSGPAATPTFRALALTDLPAGIGTVTSVGLSAPSFLNVANSPVTGSGTLDLSLATQSAALVFAGPTSGPAATPTFRALALTDLPQIATGSLLGRISAGTGTPEQISSTAALLTWLQTPTSANLSTAVTDATGAGGALVFAFGPTLTNPRFNAIAADPSGSGSNILFTPTVGAVNHIEILNAVSGSGPTIRPTGLSANQPLNLASRGTGIISCVGNQLRVTGNTAAAAGILELRGGNASLSGGQIRLYEVTTNGTNYIGFQAPDSLVSNLLFELPATDGTAGQCLRTDGAGILSFASYLPASNPAATGAMTITNSGNVVPLTVTNTGTANSLVVNDEAGDSSPFIITADGRILIGATTGGANSKMFFTGSIPISATVSQVLGMGGTFDVGCSFGYGNGTRFDVSAGATLSQITHYGAFQGTFVGSVNNQIAFEAANLTGGINNYGFFSSITAGSGRWAFYADGGANSLFNGQVQFATGTTAAPSITIQNDLDTGFAQLAGANSISITTGGNERLRAKSGGAIRFLPLAAAPGSPEAGDVYYNSTTNKLQVYNGTLWQDLN